MWNCISEERSWPEIQHHKKSTENKTDETKTGANKD